MSRPATRSTLSQTGVLTLIATVVAPILPAALMGLYGLAEFSAGRLDSDFADSVTLLIIPPALVYFFGVNVAALAILPATPVIAWLVRRNHLGPFHWLIAGLAVGAVEGALLAWYNGATTFITILLPVLGTQTGWMCWLFTRTWTARQAPVPAT